MGEILNINEVIKIIPSLLEYLVPGYIFITIRNFSFSKDDSKDKHIVLKSVVLSFIFLRTIYPIIRATLTYFGLPKELILCTFIFSIIVISVLYIRLDLEKYMVGILGNGKTSKEECFDVILSDNYNIGAIARVYLESEKLVYTGSLIYYDDKFAGEHRKIVLAGYSLGLFNGKEIYNYEGEESNLVVLQMKDIKRIEIFK